jgi:hypothetical protein
MAAHTGAPDRAPLRPGLRLSDILTLKDETDAGGRLLLEDSAPKKAIKRVDRAGVPMKTARSTYADTASRVGGLFNVSAYDAFRHDLGDVLDGFAWMTDQYAARNPSHKGTVQGLLDVSNLGLTLPLVLFRRGVDPVPVHGSLPTYVASLFKASRGVFSATVDMFNKKGPVPTTGADVVRFADEEGHLKRPATQRVCAAPTRLIERTIDVILTGEGANPDDSGLGELVDFARLWDFYRLQEAFTGALNHYRYVLDELVAGGISLYEPTRLFASTIEDQGRKGSFGDFTIAFLSYVNEAQRRLNLLLDRSDEVPEMLFEDVLRML